MTVATVATTLATVAVVAARVATAIATETAVVTMPFEKYNIIRAKVLQSRCQLKSQRIGQILLSWLVQHCHRVHCHSQLSARHLPPSTFSHLLAAAAIATVYGARVAGAGAHIPLSPEEKSDATARVFFSACDSSFDSGSIS